MEPNLGAKLKGIDAFCGERYWDPAIWNASVVPILTQCYQHTTLVWFPTAIVFLLASIMTVQIFYRRPNPIPWTRRIQMKVGLACILIADSLSLFTVAIYETIFQGFPYAVDFVYPLTLCLAMVVLTALIVSCHNYGIVTSGELFISWLVFTLSAVPELLYWIQKIVAPVESWRWMDYPRCIAFIVWFVCCALETCLHLEIKPHEKLGIVGRTEAGMSSMNFAIFGSMATDEGHVIVDGVNLAEIGLHNLGSNLTFIPQDPVLFSGTLPFNLDPFHHYSDENIWRALEMANLKEFPIGHYAQFDHLDHVITEDDNISVGQRQQILLARDILRKTRVLILDEATAAVDISTDSLIQKTIRDESANSTVLTGVRSLNTIMDYHRIIVLNDGRIGEFDSPQNLLANRGLELH